MAKHIGIVAVSPEGAALCYREIFRRASHTLPDPHQHPRVSLHSEPLADYIDAIAAQDWPRLGEMLARSAQILARTGAEFCITPDNAVQFAIPLAEARSPIPWLTMPDLVAHSISTDQRKVVGLIGTKMITTGSQYQTVLGLRGIKVIAPNIVDADEMDRIIFEELIFGDVLPPSQRLVLGIIDHLAERGCEAVILGCSEAPLVVTRENSKLPIYDTAAILADGAVRHAIAG